MAEDVAGRLWREFRTALKVTCGVTPSGQSAEIVSITVTVANAARRGPESPRIRFENIQVAISAPALRREFIVDHLEREEAHEERYDVPALNLGELEVTVSGRVSLDAFREVVSTGRPPVQGQVPVATYVAAVKSLDVPRWLAFLADGPTPTPSTTLGELEGMRRAHHDTRNQIHLAKGRLEKVSGIVGHGGMRDAFIEFTRSVEQFLDRIAADISVREQALRTDGTRMRVEDPSRLSANRMRVEDPSRLSAKWTRLRDEGDRLAFTK